MSPPLAQLTQLTELDLEDNNIIDITPLAELTLLNNLDLSKNFITDCHAFGHNSPG